MVVEVEYLQWERSSGFPPEAGKTTLGRGVAEILGFDFDDLDEAQTWLGLGMNLATTLDARL